MTTFEIGDCVEVTDVKSALWGQQGWIEQRLFMGYLVRFSLNPLQWFPASSLELVEMASEPEYAPSHREALLREAESLVMGDRNNTYGAPHQDFQRTADMLNALGYRSNTGDIRAHDVAMILAAVKLSRLAWSPQKRDSWVDLAGYAACGHEAFELTKESNK